MTLANGARSSRGIARLSVASDLMAVARRHSREMAARGAIFHNSSLTSDVSGWRAIGENVGRGGSANSVHNAFMGSSSHRTHILNPRYTQIGVGAVWGGSGSSRLLYVTEIFVQRGTARRVVVTRTTTRARPRPVARPAPKPKRRAPPPPTPPVPPAMTLGILLELVAMDADVARRYAPPLVPTRAR